MRKYFLVVFSLFLLCACSSSKPEDISNKIYETLDSETQTKYENRVNNLTQYINYYLPSDCAETDFNDTTITFKYNDSIILYNINIADIINSHYFNEDLMKDEGFFNEDYLFLQHEGSFIDKNDEFIDYDLRVYKVDNDYIISFKTLRDVMYGYSTPGDVVEVIRKMIVFTKLLNVNEDMVISSFSDKDVIDYQKKQINLFDYVVPVNGYLTDLINKDYTNQEDEEVKEEYFEDEVTEEYEETIDGQD